MSLKRFTYALPAGLMGAAAALAGCSSGSSPSGNGTGFVTLSVSDAPIQDAALVCIEFARVEFKRSGASSRVVPLDPPAQINLLEYQGTNAAPLLVDEELEAGEYEWIRLGIVAERGSNAGSGAGAGDTTCLADGSYIVFDDGAVHGLFVPSGNESGLKLNRGFTLPVNGTADFVAEWDLMNTIHGPPGLDPDYMMRPTVRLMDRVETGSIAGEVSAPLATAAGCEPAVYLYDEGIVPDDIEDDGDDESADPIASARVVMHSDGRFLYEIGPLLAGTYEAAFSCDVDDLLLDEDLDYVLSADNPVTVLANQKAAANFSD